MPQINSRKKSIAVSVILGITVLGTAGYFYFRPATRLPQIAMMFSGDSINVQLGIPSDNDPSDDYLIFRHQYVLSYNKKRNVANWVSWTLNAGWFGEAPRSGKFISDTTLPQEFYRVKTSDYNNSGYDRGHLVQSEERTKTDEDNHATFVLSNIIPQRPDLNQGVWLRLESYCNDLCRKLNKDLYIIAGGIFHSDRTIRHGIAVPDSCFKIIVVLDKEKSLSDITATTEVIAVVMPNENGVRNDAWEKYRTTIRRIEASTGYNFLSRVSQNIQDAIENK
jgi:endonuclease G, mitochondrial